MYEDNRLWLWHTSEDDDPEQASLAKLIDTKDPAFPSIARVLTDMRDAGVALTAETVTAAVQLGQHYHREEDARPAIPARKTNELDFALVYYVRIGNLIKIGTTRDMRQRMAQLKPEQILAAEPGSYDVEQKRHRQFAAYRSHGEYFLPAKPVTDHIASLKRRYGRMPTKSPKLNRSRTVLAKVPHTLF